MKLSVLVAATLIVYGAISSNSAVLGSPSYPTSHSSTAPRTGSVKESSESSFKNDVLASKQPVLVDFYATWCGACKKMSPIVERVSKSYGGKIVVVKVNVDKNSALAAKYNIESIPNLKLFKDGKVIDESVGVTSVADLRDKINRVM